MNHSSEKIINNFVVCVSTVNGSGSQSANSILLKALFRMGVPVGGKNIFPSNIAGLPTWFWIRASDEGYLGYKNIADIIICMNAQTAREDQNKVKSGGYFIYNSDGIYINAEQRRADINYIEIPFKQLVDQATTHSKIKKMLINIVYVGVLTHLLKIDRDIILSTIKNQFENKSSAIDLNLQGFEKGYVWVENKIKENQWLGQFPYKAEFRILPKKHVLMDGNSAAALGAVFGGCTFVSWYPITPSTSLVESYIKFSNELRLTQGGKKKFACIQAEDELSAMCMLLGAGWTGARAMTATSGPGLSLMCEAAGYSYYAEIPCVVWNVQRVGPSTGMPTRTSQSDLISAYYLSHGDTKHPILLPGNIQECFAFAQEAFDLAERLQQVVFVLSDLDLGMNFWREELWPYSHKSFDRGKVLSESDLLSDKPFFRYFEQDGDAIAPRTLPGNKNIKAAYFTRGSSHNSKGNYTESSSEYKEVVDRLSRKWETAKKIVPKPFIEDNKNPFGIIAYGTSDSPMQEARDHLKNNHIATDYLRIKALPFTEEVTDFIESHSKIFIIEQNRDAQMAQLLKVEYPLNSDKFVSVLHYDGTPITAENIFESILAKYKFLQDGGMFHG